MFVTAIFFPTFDVYSDMVFTIKLFKGNYYNQDFNYPGYCEKRGELVPPHPRFGTSMLAPFLLSWIFVTKCWYKNEQGIKQKMITFPLLILQGSKISQVQVHEPTRNSIPLYM